MIRGPGSAHASLELLEQYARGRDLGADVLWAVEAHLETCAACRARLGTAVRGATPTGGALLDRVAVRLATHTAGSPPPRPHRRWRSPVTARWAPPTLLPWLAMVVGTVAVSVGFDVAAASGSRPSLLLLLAPVAPLLGVTAAWTQGRDPAYEMVTATPRAGLELVLRRTLAVLLVVMPALTVGGLVIDASPVRWLLPCLAFTLGALALGTVTGVARACAALGLLWVAAVVGPSLAMERLPVVLTPASTPVWAVLTAVVAALLVLQRRALTRLPSGR